MDSERAKLLLSGYRPGGPEAGDPDFAEALGLAARDAELGRWFTEQSALDGLMREALRAVVPPPELRAAILHRGTVVRMLAPARWWSAPIFRLAMAAGIALALGVAALMLPHAADKMPLVVLTEEISLMHAGEKISLGAAGSDADEHRRWLAERGAPHDFGIPAALASQHGLGCQVYSIRGNRVSLLCFRLDDRRVVHYFVIDRDRLADPPKSGRTVFLDGEGLSFAAWSDERRTYVLAGPVGVEGLKRLL